MSTRIKKSAFFPTRNRTKANPQSRQRLRRLIVENLEQRCLLTGTPGLGLLDLPEGEFSHGDKGDYPNNNSGKGGDQGGIIMQGGTSFTGIVNAFNSGLAFMRQPSQVSNIVNQVFGIQLPVVADSISEIVGAAEKFVAPFFGSIDDDSSSSSIQNDLANLGFTVEYVGISPDASGDLLRAKFEKTWDPATKVLGFSDSTGFSYFDSGVEGFLGGSLSATLQPITLTATLGVDNVGGDFQFYIADGAELSVGGISVAGQVTANLAIRNLLDVDVQGPITGGLSGALTLRHPTQEAKIRLSHITNNLSQVVTGAVNGSIAFNPTLTANLPMIGSLSWGGQFSATVSAGNVSLQASVNPPSAATVMQLFQPAYSLLAGSLDLLGGLDLGLDVPVAEKSLGELLGLPEFLTGGLGGAVAQNLISPETVLKLVNGEVVDLIRLERTGGDKWSETYAIFLGAVTVPLGPIPVTASAHLSTRIYANYSYHVGVGLDTVGLYIDQGTAVRASAGIEAGITGSLSVLGLVSAELTAGVGARVYAGAAFVDPDPSDGRIYIDELIDHNSNSFGDSLINSVTVQLGGEAYGFARAVARVLFWSWEIFNATFPIAGFSAQLGGNNQTATSNPQSHRAISGRTPLGSGQLPANLLQNGTLTIDARIPGRADKANVVSLRGIDQDTFEVTWRGVGQGVYSYSQVDEFVYHGNEHADRLFVAADFDRPVLAYGYGGNDLLEVRNAHPATLYGGDGNDTLRGGSGDDWLYGEAGDDSLDGGAGNDNLIGGDGNDVIDGGSGNDTILGGDGDDILFSASGNNWIDGGDGNDAIQGGTGHDTLIGGEGNDFIEGIGGFNVIYGNAGNDTLIGGSGNDVIMGGEGDDLIFGGAGNDTLYGDEGNDTLVGESGNNEMHGGDGDDFLFGGSGNDTLYGDAGDDWLHGGDGHDVLEGGAGNDTLNGGAGNDILYGGVGDDLFQLDFASAELGSNDQIFGGTGQDTLAIVGKSSIDMIDGQPVINTDYDDYIELQQSELDPNDFVALNRDPETGELLSQLFFSIDGSTEGDIEYLAIFGLGGNDKLVAAPGFQKNLRLDGGPGNDTLIGSMGNDTLHAGPGDDQLFGVAGNNILYGESGNNTLQGGTGDDVLVGGVGNDSVIGGFGREVINGGAGNNRLVAGQSIYGSIITGGIGNDTIIGGPGRDVLIGLAGNNLILGGDLGDVIIGGSGDDTLVGESGRDTIYGTAGNNLIYTDLNNDLRAELGLPLLPELTTEEINAKEVQIEAERTYWLAVRAPLLAIPPHLRTPEQQAELARIEDILAHLGEILIDLLQYQSVTVNTAVGGDGNDTIHGSFKRDFLFGGDGDDEIHYYGNQDTIVGGSGYDTIWYRGTDGNDLIHVSANPIGGTGNLRVLLQLNGSLLGALDALGVERLGVLGLDGDDTITVNFGNQALIDVIIDGGRGDDYIDVSTLQSNATLIGGSGNDTLIGGHGNDLLEGQTGDDQLYGGGGNDTLIGGEGNDLIQGGAGNDSIIGGSGDDTIFGGDGNDWIAPGAGNNTVDAGAGDNTVIQPNIFHREFQVSTASQNGQRHPKIAVASDGSYVATWMAHGQHGSGWNIFARAFDKDGTPLSNEFTVDDWSLSDQVEPSIAISEEGIYVISWTRYPDLTHPFKRIFARRFNVKHQPISESFLVNNPHSSDKDRAMVAMGSDGSYSIIWESWGQDGSGWGIYGRRFSANGDFLGSEFRVNTTIQNYQNLPAISMASNGSFVVTWTGYSPDPRGNVYAQRYSSSGLPLGGETLVNQHTPLDQRRPSVSMADDGSFVVTWESWQQHGSDWSIFARIFDVNGVPQGDEFPVNTETTTRQRMSSVSLTPDGNSFVVVWQSWAVGSSLNSVLAKRYDINGIPKSDEIPVALQYFIGGDWSVVGTTGGGQVSVWDEEEFVATWNSLDPVTGTWGIFARQWSNHVTVLGTEVSANRSMLSIQFSEPMFQSGIHGVTNLDNWRLYEVSPGSSSKVKTQLGLGKHFETLPEPVLPLYDITYTYDSTTGISTANLLLDQPLGSGHYILAASPRIQSTAGFGIDGDGNRSPGGFYVHAFDVNASPLAVEPPKVVTSANQPVGEPVVAINQTSGNTVKAWLEPMPGAPGVIRVAAQLFSSSGVALGEKFQVNSIASPNEEGLSVAMSANGGFAVAWRSGNGIFVRHYSASGQPLGSEQRVNAVTPGSVGDHQVSMDSQGNAVVTWVRGGVGTRGVFAVRMNAQGDLLQKPDGVSAGVGDFEFRVDELPSSWNESPTVAMASDGSFAITWQRLATGGSFTSISAKRFDSLGIPIAPPDSLGLPTGVHEFQVAANSSADLIAPSLAMNERGEFALAWIEETGSGRVMVRRFDAQGRPRADAFRLDDSSSSTRSQPRIAIDRDANMAVFWKQQPQVGASSLHLRWYDRWANMLGDEIVVANAASGPGIAMDRKGNFVLVWNGSGPQGQHLYSQRYSTASPIVTSVSPSEDRSSIVVGFSQPMAESGSGNVLARENWGLLRVGGTTLQNFLTDSVDSVTFQYNEAAGQYQATVNLTEPLLPGNYRLIARRSLTNAVGLRLDGNGDGIGGDHFFGNFSIGNAAPLPSIDGPAFVQFGSVAVLNLSANDPDPGDDAGSFTYSIDWNGDGIVDQTIVGGAQLVTSHEYPTAGNYEVQITITDQHGLASQPVTHLLRVNRPPTVVSGGSYIVIEGQSLILDASGSFDPDGDPLEFSWDLNSDGLTDATGSTPIITWEQLLNLGIADGPSDFGLWLRVQDAFGGVTVAGPIALQIMNAPPVATILRADSEPIVRGQPVAFILSAADPSVIDQQIGFTYEVHWADGSQPSIYEDVPGEEFWVTYTYFTSGPKTITVYATDKDGGRSQAVELQILVEGSFTEVVGTHFYHRGSSFDTGDLAVALDTGKSLAKEGTEPLTLTYNNLINSSRGINGLVFDIQDLAGVPTGADFVFQWSPQGAFSEAENPPADWQLATAPSAIYVLPGSPDRVVIEWPDNAIANRWLRIIILPTANTGLSAPEVYYIGHLLGETTGPSDGLYSVSFADISLIRSGIGQSVNASSILDIDKNGTVSFSDISAIRGHIGTLLTNITIPGVGNGELMNAPGSGGGRSQLVPGDLGRLDVRMVPLDSGLVPRGSNIVLPDIGESDKDHVITQLNKQVAQVDPSESALKVYFLAAKLAREDWLTLRDNTSCRTNEALISEFDQFFAELVANIK